MFNRLAKAFIAASFSLLITSSPAWSNGSQAESLSSLDGTPASRAESLMARDEEPQLDDCTAASSPKQISLELDGHASHDSINTIINSLVDEAVRRDPEMEKLNHAFYRYKTRREKIAAQVTNALNWGLFTRGAIPSSEAGDVILGEKLKLKSRNSAEYARQKETDEIQLKVVSAVTDICMGLGTSDQVNSQRLVNQGHDTLVGLAGSELADRATDQLRQIAATLNVSEAAYSQEVWGAQEYQDLSKYAMEAAMEADPVVIEIKRLVNKYNHHSRLYRISSRVMNVSLSLGGLSPTIVAPISQVALLTYVMLTGGPEEDKLMTELYLDKRLDSRFQLLSGKVQLAMEKYQLAKLTRNPMLLFCSQSVLSDMTSEAVAQRLCSPKTAEKLTLSATMN